MEEIETISTLLTFISLVLGIAVLVVFFIMAANLSAIRKILKAILIELRKAKSDKKV